MADAKTISTTALAKKHGMHQKALFSQLEHAGLINRQDGVWTLTQAGEARGGTYMQSKDFGKYVGWPEDLDLEILYASAPTPVSSPTSGTLLTATAVGNHFGLSANKCNYILSELGWVKKSLRGWVITDPGERMGGRQSEDHRSGIPYVRWPESILSAKALLDTIAEVKGTSAAPPAVGISADKADDFRDRFPATHRAADGHFVRSRAEMLIDNWLYMAEIVHAYERKLPIEEDVYCDFYIPTGKVYIEFWGLENEPKYQARKAQKKAIYEKYGFNLIELGDADVQNLDDILPRHLLKYGVQAY